jgi:hypothetical protein
MPTGTTKLFTHNYSLSPTATLEFTPNESPSGPALNLLSPDRYAVWQCPGSLGDESPMLDLGTNQAVDYLGLLNFRYGSEFANPTSFIVENYVTFPDPVVATCTTSTSVNPNQIKRTSFSFAGAGVKIGQTIVGQVPSGIFPANTTVLAVATGVVTVSNNALSTQASATFTFTDKNDVGSFSVRHDCAYPIVRSTRRYWRFIFSAVFNPFSLGNFFLGRLVTVPANNDLGIVWSPGSTERRIPAINQLLTAGGNQHAVRYGIDRRELNIQLNAVNQAKLDAVEDLYDMRQDLYGPPVILTGWDVAYQVQPRDLVTVNRWGNPDLYDIALNLDVMP